MDVKSLLNAEESAPRPSLQRFGPFKPHQSEQSAGAPQPHASEREYRHRLPSLGDAPSPSLRSLSYSSSSTSSSSSCQSLSAPFAASRTNSTDLLPPISSRVPSLVRSESGGSQSPRSPSTPSGTPSSTPAQQYSTTPLRAQANIKSVPFINLPLPRPQIVSTSSFSAAPSGPPSSMDSFATTPNNLGFADLTFPYATSQSQPAIINPQASLSGSSEPQHNSISPPSSASHTTNNPSNTSSSSKTPQKKNSYPCPLAKQFGCSEYFTTSGHAARHAKKHTGKKDAICPECSKAFTRKDNMEQHRRTHAKDSANASRTASKGSSEKDESRQRKLMKLQQHKKSRTSSLSTASSAGIAAANNQLNNTTSPSTSSALTSPTSTSYPTSSSGPVQMDGTLDPRLRESPSSVNSGSVSAFSPTPFTPAAYGIPDTTNQVFPQNFNTMFSPPPQMSLPQQMPAQVIPQHSMNMTTANPLATTISSPMDSFPQRPLHRASYSNQLDYRLQQSPTESPMLPDALGLNMPMSMPATTPLDMNMNQGMAMMMDAGLGLGPMMAGVPQSPAIVAGGAGGDGAPVPGIGVTPAFDRLSLDKLALAAEAARNNGN